MVVLSAMTERKGSSIAAVMVESFIVVVVGMYQTIEWGQLLCDRGGSMRR